MLRFSRISYELEWMALASFSPKPTRSDINIARLHTPLAVWSFLDRYWIPLLEKSRCHFIFVHPAEQWVKM